jgi:hypothetical protein
VIWNADTDLLVVQSIHGKTVCRDGLLDRQIVGVGHPADSVGVVTVTVGELGGVLQVRQVMSAIQVNWAGHQQCIGAPTNCLVVTRKAKQTMMETV